MGAEEAVEAGEAVLEEWNLAKLPILIYAVMVASTEAQALVEPLLYDYFYDLSYQRANLLLDLHAGLRWPPLLLPRLLVAAVRQPWLCCVPELLGSFCARCFLLVRVELTKVPQRRWFRGFHHHYPNMDIASLLVLFEPAVKNRKNQH